MPKMVRWFLNLLPKASAFPTFSIYIYLQALPSAHEHSAHLGRFCSYMEILYEYENMPRTRPSLEGPGNPCSVVHVPIWAK